MNRAGAGLQDVLGELSGNHWVVFPSKPGGDLILRPTLLAHCRVGPWQRALSVSGFLYLYLEIEIWFLSYRAAVRN